jgi:azurin
MSDSHEQTTDKASIWSSLSILLSLALTLFVLVSGASFILGSLSFTRAIEHPAPPAAPSAPAPATAAAAPAAAPSGTITEITLKPGPVNPMSFETTSFKVKAGSKIKVTFSNEGNAPLQHNLVIGKIGSKDKLIAASNSMLTDMAGAMAKGYIPDSPEILAHTKLLNLHDKETLEITVPAEKGAYPYLCTFPGHAAIMNGTMEVE